MKNNSLTHKIYPDINWNAIIDDAIEKPQFIKINNDTLALFNTKLIKETLKDCKFNAIKYIEDDGSVTISLDAIDLAENALTESEAKIKLAKSIKEYSEEFYAEFDLYSSDHHRKKHIPYILKSLFSETINEVIETINIISFKEP